MNTGEKEQMVTELNQLFSQSNTAFLLSYQGTTCKELTTLRGKLRNSQAKCAVVKNTLAVRAAKGTPAEKLESYFVGPTAVVWSDKDPVGPAKIVHEVLKESEKLSVRAGVVDGRVVTAKEVEELSKMPGKEELLSKLLALINAPATRLLQTVNAPASSLARVLEAWRKKQGGE